MLKFVLTKETGSNVLYHYYPEGGSEHGVVSVDKKTGDGAIETLSNNDKHQRYALKALKKIREMASNGFFEEEGMVAWY